MTGWHILISSSDLCVFSKRTNHSIPLNRSTDLLEFDFLEYRFQVDIPHRIDRFSPLIAVQPIIVGLLHPHSVLVALGTLTDNNFPWYPSYLIICRRPSYDRILNSASKISFLLSVFLLSMASYTPSSYIASAAIQTPASSGRSVRSPSPSSASSRSSISNRISLSSRNLSMHAMSLVDTAAIENSMKIASLDTLAGFNPNTYGEVVQGPPTEYVKRRDAKGYQILKEPAFNLGKSCVPPMLWNGPLMRE